MRRSIYCLTFLSVFFAGAIEAQTISVSPSSGNQYQTFEVTITGQGTNFKSPNLGIVFYLDANDSFYAVPNATQSQFKMTAYVSIPGNVRPGTYDVRIVDTLTDSVYYLATQSFFVNPGPPPSISTLPDSGGAGTNFSVLISGSNTFFNAAANSSKLDEIAVDLIAFNSVYYSAHPLAIESDSEMKVLFNLPDTLPAGDYILRCHTLSIEPSFDVRTYFFIKRAPVITLTNAKSGEAGYPVSVDILVQGSPIPGPNTQVFISPAGNSAAQVSAQSVTLTSDSTLTALFNLPSKLTPGLYDLTILAFQEFNITAKNVFTVVPFSIVDASVTPVASIEVSPNPAQSKAEFSFSLPKTEHAKLILFDALGRTIATLFDEIASGTQVVEWNSDNIPNGSYFYQLSEGEATYRGTVIVQH
jgi:hypothetical protein